MHVRPAIRTLRAPETELVIISSYAPSTLITSISSWSHKGGIANEQSSNEVAIVLTSAKQAPSPAMIASEVSFQLGPPHSLVYAVPWYSSRRGSTAGTRHRRQSESVAKMVSSWDSLAGSPSSPGGPVVGSDPMHAVRSSIE